MIRASDAMDNRYVTIRQMQNAIQILTTQGYQTKLNKEYCLSIYFILCTYYNIIPNQMAPHYLSFRTMVPTTLAFEDYYKFS